MKHLKKFNEELQPSTYVSAGTGLKSKGHEERGQKLIDYGKLASPITDEFEFYSHGKHFTAKWDYVDNIFKSENDDRVYLRGGILQYSAYPIMKGGRHPQAYVGNRTDAVKLHKFLKDIHDSLGRLDGSLPTINDLYRDPVPPKGRDRDEQQKAKRFEDTFPKTKGPGGPTKKPNIFKRISDWASGEKDKFFKGDGEIDQV